MHNFLYETYLHVVLGNVCILLWQGFLTSHICRDFMQEGLLLSLTSRVGCMLSSLASSVGIQWLFTGPAHEIACAATMKRRRCSTIGTDFGAEVAHLSARLKSLRQEVRRTKRKQGDAGRRGIAWTRACALTFACQGNLDAAKHFLREHSKLSREESDRMATLLQTWWNTREAGAGHDAKVEDSLRCPKVLRQASSYLKEHRLYAWVGEQNLTKGLAPHSAIVNAVRNADTGCSPATGQMPKQLEEKSRQWLRRWRQRWRIRMGRIAARECIPDCIAQEKAKLVVVCWAPHNPPPPLPLFFLP